MSLWVTSEHSALHTPCLLWVICVMAVPRYSRPMSALHRKRPKWYVAANDAMCHQRTNAGDESGSV
jgi:hypothetical protein